jgi:hypothetical protein
LIPEFLQADTDATGTAVELDELEELGDFGY